MEPVTQQPISQVPPEVANPTLPVVSPPTPNKPWKKYILPLLSVLLLVGGVVVGIVLVLQNQNIAKKAAGSWSINATLGMECSGSNCTLTYSNSTTTCEGMTASSFYCPGGLVNGRCFENEQGLGGFQRGQTVDVMSFTSGKSCGAVQVDWNAPGSASSTGDCGGVTLINSEICSGGGGATTPPGGGGGGGGTPATPTPTPKAVCGESCTTTDDCGGSTVDGIQVVCRQNKCVNLECSNQGGQTIFGTRCDCIKPHECGAQCGADVGLCEEGLSCTYRAQSLCGVAEHGYCVPRGIADAGRGRMEGVPAYDGSYFQRRACGSSTTDAQNNYIYHASFPDHAFSRAEILKYICNPTTPTPTPTPTPTITPTPTPTPTTPPDDTRAQCIDIRLYNLSWQQLSAAQLSELKSGDQIYATIRGSTTKGTITRARFYVNGTFAGSTAEKRANTEQFYLKVTVPDIPDTQNGMRIKVEGQLYHSGLKQWF